MENNTIITIKNSKQLKAQVTRFLLITNRDKKRFANWHFVTCERAWIANKIVSKSQSCVRCIWKREMYLLAVYLQAEPYRNPPLWTARFPKRDWGVNYSNRAAERTPAKERCTWSKLMIRLLSYNYLLVHGWPLVTGPPYAVYAALCSAYATLCSLVMLVMLMFDT